MIDRQEKTGGIHSVCLLSNIMLNELDKELERRALRFVRYADGNEVLTKHLLKVINTNRRYKKKVKYMKV